MYKARYRILSLNRRYLISKKGKLSSFKQFHLFFVKINCFYILYIFYHVCLCTILDISRVVTLSLLFSFQPVFTY